MEQRPFATNWRSDPSGPRVPESGDVRGLPRVTTHDPGLARPDRPASFVRRLVRSSPIRASFGGLLPPLTLLRPWWSVAAEIGWETAGADQALVRRLGTKAVRRAAVLHHR